MQTQTYQGKEKAEIVIANWYDALKQIKDRKGRVGRMSELISARNDAEFNETVWLYGAYTKAGLDYAQNNPVLLLRENSELLQLDNAKKAVQLHRNGKAYPLTQEAYDSHLKQAEKEAKSKSAPEKRSILILPERETFSINSQNYFDFLRFLAEDPKQAEKYLERLSEKDINQVEFYLRNKSYVGQQEAPFQDQLWAHSLGGMSSFSGGKVLDSDGNWLLGVFSIGEASSKKIERSAQKLPYSIKEAQKIYKIVQEIRESNIKLSDLESKLSQVSDFLENLSK